MSWFYEFICLAQGICYFTGDNVDISAEEAKDA